MYNEPAHEYKASGQDALGCIYPLGITHFEQETIMKKFSLIHFGNLDGIGRQMLLYWGTPRINYHIIGF